MFISIKARALLEKESESRSCISSDGFLTLFNNPSLALAKTSDSQSSTNLVSSSNASTALPVEL